MSSMWLVRVSDSLTENKCLLRLQGYHDNQRLYVQRLMSICTICILQTLQRDQKAEIAHLEQEVHTMRAKHSEAIQKLKSQFLREKRTYQKESDTKIQEMAQQASQVCAGQVTLPSYVLTRFTSVDYHQLSKT